MDLRLSTCGTETVAFAGEELKRYFTLMLPEEQGAFSVELRVCPQAGNDSYLVSMDIEGGSIVGSNERSVLLGVYDYLRRLGCRFLAPGPECEIIPLIDRASLVAHYSRTASFFFRGVCIEGADSPDNILSCIDWLPKVGYNSFFLQFNVPYSFLARWYEHHLNPYAEGRPYTSNQAAIETLRFEAALKKRGLMLHKVGHGWTGQVLGYESISWDSTPKPLSPVLAHRAAEINGVRNLYKGVPTNTNLCYYNADAMDAFAALVVEYAKENRAVDYLHIWLADAYNNVCECADCSKTTVADQYVALLNEIDRRLTAEDLPTRIVFLLYQELLWPPIKERLLNEERFVLMFAPISRTFEDSYRLEGIPDQIPPFVRNHITLPASIGENLAFLRGWQTIFHGDSFIYDYPLGRAHYGDFSYLHMARIIHADIKKLHAIGMEGYISCQELRVTMPNALPNYVMGRTLFDVSEDVEGLIGEYFAAAYGAHAREARAYLEALGDRAICDYLNGKGNRIDPSITQKMVEIMEICDEFGPVADAHSGDSFFWHLLSYHCRYVRLLSRAIYHLSRGEEELCHASCLEMREFVCLQEPGYQPYFDVYRILEVTGKYTGFRYN